MDPQKINEKAWELIRAAVDSLRKEGATLEEIGTLCGTKKATIHRWIKEKSGGERNSFVDMLRYIQVFNIPYEEVFSLPLSGGSGQTSEILRLRKELEEKNRQIEELAKYKSRWEGLLEIREREEETRIRVKALIFEDYKKKHENAPFSNEPTSETEGQCNERHGAVNYPPSDEWIPPDT